MQEITRIKEIEILANYDDVLTFHEFQQILKIGKNQAYKLLQNNTIKSFKIGTKYRIPKINIINYLQKVI